MITLALHAQQQISGPHGSWNIKGVAAEFLQNLIVWRWLLGLALVWRGHQLENVLDVDDADRIIQRVAEDRHTRMFGFDKTRH